MSSNRLRALQSLARELQADFVNCWIPIAQSTLTGSVASVTFSSIPDNFRHLCLMLQARTDLSAEADNVMLRFNGDATASYDIQQVAGNGSSATAQAFLAQNSVRIGLCDAANSRLNNFSPAFCVMFGYVQTDREKWSLSLSARKGDVSAITDMTVGLRKASWRNSSAITSITLLPETGTNFVSGSKFALYGIL